MNAAFEYQIIIDHLKFLQITTNNELTPIIDTIAFLEEYYGYLDEMQLTDDDKINFTKVMDNILLCSNGDQLNINNVNNDLYYISDSLRRYFNE